tara:strand:- start:14 stop:184 length:171 start_codon:yes stop_codon:yes gene_type:complete
MGLFSFLNKKTEKEKLQEKYKALLKESFDLSKIDRAKSDAKRSEAEKLAEKIDKLP